jgi:hypothetical protein
MLTQATPEEDEINPVDLLQVVVDNLRLLIPAPLAAGIKNPNDQFVACLKK